MKAALWWVTMYHILNKEADALYEKEPHMHTLTR